MNEFKKEDRYFVIKKNDAGNYLSSAEYNRLLDLLDDISTRRSDDKKAQLNCVVVESDWPEYNLVWDLIEYRATSGENKSLMRSVIDIEIEKDVKKAFSLVLGHFVGMARSITSNDGDRDIKIDTPNDSVSPSITIHSTTPTHYVHHLGPDDVYGPMTELEASRLANELNTSSALCREDSPNRDFLPYSMALVKTAEQLNGGAA